jgi:hypothetical protein
MNNHELSFYQRFIPELSEAVYNQVRSDFRDFEWIDDDEGAFHPMYDTTAKELNNIGLKDMFPKSIYPTTVKNIERKTKFNKWSFKYTFRDLDGSEITTGLFRDGAINWAEYGMALLYYSKLHHPKVYSRIIDEFNDIRSLENGYVTADQDYMPYTGFVINAGDVFHSPHAPSGGRDWIVVLRRANQDEDESELLNYHDVMQRFRPSTPSEIERYIKTETIKSIID